MTNEQAIMGIRAYRELMHHAQPVLAFNKQAATRCAAAVCFTYHLANYATAN